VRARTCGCSSSPTPGSGAAPTPGSARPTPPRVVVANADVRFAPGARAALAARWPRTPDVGPSGRGASTRTAAAGVGAALPDPLTAVGHALLALGRPGNRGPAATGRPTPTRPRRDVDWLSGCALALRRRGVRRGRRVRPRLLPLRRGRRPRSRLRDAGWRLRYDPDEVVVHRVGASTGALARPAVVARARASTATTARRYGRPRRAAAPPLLRVALAAGSSSTSPGAPSARGRSTTGECRRRAHADRRRPRDPRARASRDRPRGLIVAGGAGTRLRPLTDTTPKPLLPFCGAPFLAGVIRGSPRRGRAGAARGRRRPAPFEVLRPDAAPSASSSRRSPRPEPLDTAGGVRAALDRVAAPSWCSTATSSPTSTSRPSSRPPRRRRRRDARAHPGRGHLELRGVRARGHPHRRLRREARPGHAARPGRGQRRHLRARARRAGGVPRGG
jgi:N-acetylglucosaminyl-diphospho-decaprenol L-rhamnosyltransferase